MMGDAPYGVETDSEEEEEERVRLHLANVALPPLPVMAAFIPLIDCPCSSLQVHPVLLMHLERRQ